MTYRNINNKEEIFKETNQLALFHSASLEFIYHNISDKESNGEFDSRSNIDDSVDKLLSADISGSLTTMDIELIKEFYARELIEEPLNVPSGLRERMSLYQFFLEDISSINESDISLETIRNKLFSEVYLNLDDETFYELSIIGSTYLDSYNYWTVNLEKWNELRYFDNSDVQARGYWRGVLRYVNKDANAASAILISAAVITAATGGTGAVVTAPALLIGAGIRSALPF